MKSLIITTLCTQRSGSKAFGSLFATGSEIVPLGELFNPDEDGPLSFRGFVQGQRYEELIKIGSSGILDKFFGYFAHHRMNLHCDIMFNQLEIPCLAWNEFDELFTYGYLRSRRCAVILLTREPADSFKSMLGLQLTQVAHVLNRVPGVEGDAEAPLEVAARRDDFVRYERKVQFHYHLARESFRDYPYFCEMSFEEFASTQTIPTRVIDMLLDCARERQIFLRPELIQMSRPIIGRGRESVLRLID